MAHDDLGKRMKENYENISRYYLTRRTPVIIRLDGKSFHTLTKRFDKPFDNDFMDAMQFTALSLCKNIQGVKFAYTQSDEISLLITDFDTLTTDAPFKYNLQKLVSISASMATVYFYNLFTNRAPNKLKGFPVFDSRAFNIPKEEVCNYFVWRQKDWNRNSINMVAQTQFSHKELHKKNVKAVHEMLYEKGINWDACSPYEKNGAMVITKDNYITAAVTFTQNREVIENLLTTTEE